jgi:hypothetical protein
MPEDIDRFVRDFQAVKSTTVGADQESVESRYQKALISRELVRIDLPRAPHLGLTFSRFADA